MGRFWQIRHIDLARQKSLWAKKANMSTDIKTGTFHEAIFAHFKQQMYVNLT